MKRTLLLTGLLSAACMAAQAGDLPPLKLRRVAAELTASSDTNACAAIRPFYWEVGNKLERQASGTLTVPRGPKYEADTILAIASASKWLYAAYVVQKKEGVLSEDDIDHLRFRSGYTNFRMCRQDDSVDSCLKFLRNGKYTASTDGIYLYNGGHMQKHAQMMGLGAMKNAALAAEVRSQIDIPMTYGQPQPAGGVVTTAENYALFLRKVLNGDLLMRGKLGKYAVCTNPTTCDKADYTPVPLDERWHYSMGHWVEDDPQDGDGAFSSAGAFGFYPWIDADRLTYGVIARKGDPGTGSDSMYCGRLIRKAFLTGIPQ